MNRVWILLFLSFQLSAFAQQEGVTNSDSAFEAEASPYRRLLLDSFTAKRLDAVSQLLDSLEQRREPLPLWPAERLLLYYWTERYSALDSLAMNFDAACEEAATNHPAEEAVWNVLAYHSSENIDTLVAWIDQTGCSDEAFNFRVQLLETLADQDGEDQEAVNRSVKALIGQYSFPETGSSTEGATMAPQPLATDDPYNDDPHDGKPWGGIGIGLGPSYLSGNITDYLSTNACLAFNFDVNYRRWRFSFLMQAIFGKLQQDVPVSYGSSELWEAGKSVNVFDIGLTLGYSVVDSRLFTLTPFLGFSFNKCAPSQMQTEDDAAQNTTIIPWGFTSMYGLNMDVKLYNLFRFKRSRFPASFNIRMNYIPSAFDRVSLKYSGNMVLVTFGVVVDVW